MIGFMCNAVNVIILKTYALRIIYSIHNITIVVKDESAYFQHFNGLIHIKLYYRFIIELNCFFFSFFLTLQIFMIIASINKIRTCHKYIAYKHSIEIAVSNPPTLTSAKLVYIILNWTFVIKTSRNLYIFVTINRKCEWFVEFRQMKKKKN